MAGLTNPLAFFGSDAAAATIRQAHAQRLLAAAQGAEIRHWPQDTACPVVSIFGLKIMWCG